MPVPTLTPEEQAQVTKQAAAATSTAALFTAQIAQQTAQAAALGLSDNAFKKFFDYYNTNIIGKYDAERQALNGTFQASPIVEADLINCANITGRLAPTLPATDVIRVAEFDGGNTSVNVANETQNISDQAGIETTLVSGYGAVTIPATMTTNSSLTSSSTTLQLKDTASAITIPANSVIIVQSGGVLAVVKLLTVVPVVGGPPFLANTTIQLIVAPGSTLASGILPQQFTGFTNGERTAKTSATLQALMNNLVSSLQTTINARITQNNAQIAAIAANQDPDGTAQFTTATTNNNTAKTFLTAYLVSTDISNTGLSSLSTERTTRSGQITARVAQIVANYTGQTLNYYNSRYLYANNRGNTSRGTLRLQIIATSVASTSATYAASATAQAAALNSLP